MTDASLPSPSSTGRRRAAREREYRRVAHSGDGAGGLVLCGDRARGGDLARAGAPDRRPDLRGGRERRHAMAETIQRHRERHDEAPPDGSDSPIAEAALDAPQAIDS